jgi:hypothetical protein
MNRSKIIDFLILDLWAYLLAAVASFAIGTYLLHWSAGLALSVAIIIGMRSMTPAFQRLLGKTGGQA